VNNSTIDILQINSHKFIVAILVRNFDGKVVFLKWAKDLFMYGTGAIMTGCSRFLTSPMTVTGD